MQQVLHETAVGPDEILRRNATTVYRLAYARTRKTSDAEDIFQEVFLRYMRRMPAFDSAEHEKAWFLKVTVNCIKSYYTTAEARHATTVETMPEGESEPQDDFALMLLALPEEYRVEVHLYYGERMPIRQIAQMTHRTENAVRVRLTRARKMLRQSLEGSDMK